MSVPNIDELLGRSFVPPDRELLGQALTDKVVMVTGAGGSIGSELCRQIARVGPIATQSRKVREWLDDPEVLVEHGVHGPRVADDQSGQQSSSTASVRRRTFVPFAFIT